MLRDWIGKIRFFFNEDPKRARFISFVILLIAIPITVFAALTVQNLIQRAGGGSTVQIVDVNGNSISKTSDPQVYLKITLPADWIAVSQTKNYSLIGETYAQSSCPTITCGTNSGAGGICKFGDPIEGKNSNVSGCTATCPNGKKVPGFSVSVCQSDNCYYNDCTCYPNTGACDSVSTPTPISTPNPVSTPTSGSTFVPGTNIDCRSPGYSSDICNGNPFAAGGVCSGNAQVTLKCARTCPNGNLVTGESYSVCQSNGCFFNDCRCVVPGQPTKDVLTLCGSSQVSTPTPTPTPSGIVCSAPNTAVCPTNCYGSSNNFGRIECRQIGTNLACGNPTCVTPTPTPKRALKNLYIANGDTDGSAGGNDQLNITSNFEAYLNKPIPWRLNPLLGGQSEASRIVQVTLFDGKDFVPFAAAVTLFRPTQQTGTILNVAVSFMCNLSQISQGSVCHGSALAYDSAGFPIFDGVTYEWGVSSVEGIGTLEKTQGNITGFVAKNIGTGSVWVIARQGNRQEKKAVEVIVVPSGKISAQSLPSTATGGNINDVINQFGQRGSNLSGDVNRDGIVDGIDYNILLRNEQVITP